MKRRDLYKSPHAGFAVKVRSALDKHHPTTGHVIHTTPSVWANFGEPTGSVQIINPLTGESDVVETYRGGTFDLQLAAEELKWDEDVQLMVRDTLDMLCEKTPAQIQRVDYVVTPAEKPWPTYDLEAATTADEVDALVATAAKLGLVGKTLAYERENANREPLIAALEKASEAHSDPEPEPTPVLASRPSKKPEELTRVAVF